MDDKQLKELDSKISAQLDQNQPVQDNGAAFSPQNYKLSEEEKEEIKIESDLEKKYGDSDIKAAALGAARGLSFGLSDQGLVKSGIYTKEDLKEVKKRNELASITGEVGATAASILATGGTGLAAKGLATVGKGVSTLSKAGLAAEKLTQKAFAKVLSEQGKKSVIKDIVRRSAPKAIGSAIEGSAYGIGQLVSEDALGNAELNAENVISAAGTGALLGGVAGGMFAAPAALIPAAKKAVGKITSKIKVPDKLKSDPVEASLDIYGVTPAQRTKLKKQSSKFIEELPEWTVNKAKLGVFTGTKKLRDSVIKIREEAGDKIGNTMTKIDEVAVNNPGILSSSKEAYGNVASKIDNIVKEFDSIPGFKGQLKPVKDIRDEFIELAKDANQINTKKIHELRMKIDELIKFDKSPGQYTLKDKALNQVRHALNDEIQSIAEKASNIDGGKVFGSLLDDLKTANKDFSYSSRLIPMIEKKADKEASKRNILSLMDTVTGGSLIASGMGGTAAAVVGAKKLLESDIRRRVIILSSIEKQNQKVSKNISSGVSEFLKKAARGVSGTREAVKSSTTKALISSNLSIPLEEDRARKPKNKKQAFKNIKTNINELMVNPEKLQELLTRRTIHLQNIAPNITQAAIQKAMDGLQFLDRKLPKSTKENITAKMFNKREYEPSEMQFAKFERYVHAVENPMSVIQDLKEGTLTREAAEALKTVYPMIFEKLQNSVMEGIMKNPDALSYTKRLEVGILLDIPSDSSLEPQNIAALQQNVQFSEQDAPESSTAPTAARADKLEIAGREETKQNRIAQR